MWSPQHRSLTIIIIAGLALSNAILLSFIIMTFSVTPGDVYKKLTVIESEMKIHTAVTREVVMMNAEEIDRLRAQMKARTEQLRRANEALLKLDPTYRIEHFDDYEGQ